MPSFDRVPSSCTCYHSLWYYVVNHWSELKSESVTSPLPGTGLVLISVTEKTWQRIDYFRKLSGYVTATIKLQRHLCKDVQQTFSECSWLTICYSARLKTLCATVIRIQDSVQRLQILRLQQTLVHSCRSLVWQSKKCSVKKISIRQPDHWRWENVLLRVLVGRSENMAMLFCTT